ncbi:MAG: hypothetical protein EBS90_10480 [Betaproteobacteria bacterium]|nr:hypothetical protein [Betaproteobacteria bacterium]
MAAKTTELVWTEEDLADYNRHLEEDERRQPWCHYCHPESGCDGDHGDECRDVGPIYKGRRDSPPELYAAFHCPLYSARAKVARIALKGQEAEKEYADAIEELEEIEDGLLPLGSHLLPYEYRKFLLHWNNIMQHYCGGWAGKERRLYKATHPIYWKMFLRQTNELSAKYRQEVLAVKQYQAEHSEEAVYPEKD